jgi:hypothetical protein
VKTQFYENKDVKTKRETRYENKYYENKAVISKYLFSNFAVTTADSPGDAFANSALNKCFTARTIISSTQRANFVCLLGGKNLKTKLRLTAAQETKTHLREPEPV